MQQAAEALIRNQAAAELYMELASAMVHIGNGVAVQTDDVASGEAVLLALTALASSPARTCAPTEKLPL